MFLCVLFLCACVIKSENEIINNDQSEKMFGGEKNLMWVGQDKQEIMLERMNGKFDRTYIARSLDDLSDSIIVRFMRWDEESLIPNEDVYIVSGFEENRKEKIYYYQLLTYDPDKKVWTSWTYEDPDNTEIKVMTMPELKKSFRKMLQTKQFKRQELLAFTKASDWNFDNIDKK